MSAQTAARRVSQGEELGNIYDQTFYDSQIRESLKSSRHFLKFLWQYFQPQSVLDVGCGRGCWLKTCHDLGSKNLFGLDGSWNNQSLMLDQAIQFRSIDLDKPFAISQKVDLVMTLEVAEHLQPSSAAPFVKSLTEASDAVLFSAAYTGQGGTNHINEQPHTYWAKMFLAQGYVCFDLFRPVFWGDAEVCFWYRQNTFLYVKKDSPVYGQLRGQGLEELKNITIMDCIHPELYKAHIGKASAKVGFRQHLSDLGPSFLRMLERRLKLPGK